MCLSAALPLQLLSRSLRILVLELSAALLYYLRILGKAVCQWRRLGVVSSPPQTSSECPPLLTWMWLGGGGWADHPVMQLAFTQQCSLSSFWGVGVVLEMTDLSYKWPESASNIFPFCYKWESLDLREMKQQVGHFICLEHSQTKFDP